MLICLDYSSDTNTGGVSVAEWSERWTLVSYIWYDPGVPRSIPGTYDMIQGSRVQFLGRSITLAMIVESAWVYEMPTHAEKALRVKSSEDSDSAAVQRGRCQASSFVEESWR